MNSEQRMARIDELAGQNYCRLNEALGSQEHVYRYTTRQRMAKYLEAGRIDRPGYMSTEFSDLSSVTMGKNQVLPEWGRHQVGIRIPIKSLVGPAVPRPMGGKATTGWELYTNSYPEAGSGGWLQFLAETDSFAPSWVFDLQP